jgi:general secretion pathway protein G
VGRIRTWRDERTGSNDKYDPSVFAARMLEYRDSKEDRRQRRENSLWRKARKIRLSALECFFLALLALIIWAAVGSLFPYNANPKPNATLRATMMDLQTIATQLKIFQINSDKYPTTSAGLNALVTAKLLKKALLDPWGHPYVYRCPGRNGSDFDLYSIGPNGLDDNGGGDDISFGGSGL